MHNLLLACKECNHDKSDMDIGAFLRGLVVKRTGKVMQVHAVNLDAPLVPKFPPPKKKLLPPQEIVPWNEGHEDARKRIASVKRSVEDQQAIDAGWSEHIRTNEEQPET